MTTRSGGLLHHPAALNRIERCDEPPIRSNKVVAILEIGCPGTRHMRSLT